MSERISSNSTAPETASPDRLPGTARGERAGPATADDLSAQLAAKDRMIAVLTERLAEAADQLDRLKRMGVDRGAKAAGLPRELIEQQQQLAERLREFMHRWDEANAFDRLLRMEQGISALLAEMPPGNRSGDSVSEMVREKRGREGEGESEADAKSNKGFWEAAKARLLAGAEEAGANVTVTGTESNAAAAENSVEAAVLARVADGAREGNDPSVSAPSTPAAELIEEPPPPQPVHADATTVELHQAVDARDAYISFLVTRLRHVEERTAGPIDWDALQSAPAELVERLQKLETQLKEQLARTEVAHSLERAALTRDRVRLQQVKQQLEQEIRRLGSRSAEDKGPPRSEERRLFGLIGRKK